MNVEFRMMISDYHVEMGALLLSASILYYFVLLLFFDAHLQLQQTWLAIKIYFLATFLFQI